MKRISLWLRLATERSVVRRATVTALLVGTLLSLTTRGEMILSADFSMALSWQLGLHVWGDTVNIASRMESLGIPGQIQVTESTYQRLKHAFEFEPRGSIEVKGLGPTETYFITGRIG